LAGTSEAVDVFILSRKAKGLSPQTIRWYKGILAVFESEFKKLPKKPEQIELFFASLNVGDERQHGYYRAIRCLYRFLNRRYKVKNPIEYIDPPTLKRKQPVVLTPIEINKLLCTSIKPEIKKAIMFLSDTGARLGEYLSLSIENIEEAADGFTVKITGKTGERTIPVSYEVYHALMVNPPKKRSRSWLSHQISRAFKEANLKGSALTLRHSFATIWGGDELVLQQIMGHSNLSTTRLYRQLRTKTLIKQHNQYSPLKMVLSSSKSML